MKPDLSINYAIDIVKTSEYIKVVDVYIYCRSQSDEQLKCLM